ncbi:MAG: hypothetical protein JOZ81_19755 [Chloroflexi bacterium]|nr:hypothetical protein [Chloroflexota bacterium]
MRRTSLIELLRQSDEPSIHWRVLVKVLDTDPHAPQVQKVEQEIANSARVRCLLAGLAAERHVYAKWQGAHWIFSALAELGYPSGDRSLLPAARRVLDCWLDERYYMEFEATTRAAAYRRPGVPIMRQRYRRCASQQGAALWFLTRLGLIGREDADRLVERLLHWQWPDGGWNCDKEPDAHTSSFMETLLPMRGLAVDASQRAKSAANRAAEVLLERGLFKRRSNGQVIHPEFVKLHYPPYWHYDVLTGLKGLAELDLLGDPRCKDALDLLEQKELPGGGWPAERRYYSAVTSNTMLHADLVDWRGRSRTRMNEWVTTDALYVLRVAGRL